MGELKAADIAAKLRESVTKVLEFVPQGELDSPQSVARIYISTAVNLACELLENQLTIDDAIRIARGCLDYGGGHHGEPEKLEAFHHGIETVVRSLEAAKKNGFSDPQVTALYVFGGTEGK